MATVEKRGKMWSVRYVIHDAYGNKVGQKRVSGFATKAEAMAAAGDLEKKSDAGIDVHGASATCGEIMERWFSRKIGTIEATTLAKYSSWMDQLQGHPIYNTPVRNLNRDTLKMVIDDLVTQRGISVRSARDYTEPLRLALSWAQQGGIIPLNPLAGAPMPKPERSRQMILDDDGINDLINKCLVKSPSFYTPLLLVLYGGLCREESSGLRWDCVDIEKRTITIRNAVTLDVNGKEIEKTPKTACRSRTVTMPAFVMDHLASLKHTSDYVCTSSKGERYSVHTYACTMRRLVAAVNEDRKKAGRPLIPAVSYHDLRHTHAAMLIKMGVHMKVISERLGHASIKITMDLYGYLMPGMQEQVADQLDQAWGNVGNGVGNRKKVAS